MKLIERGKVPNLNLNEFLITNTINNPRFLKK